MRNARLDEAQAGIKIAGRNINNLRYANINHSNGRKWRGTKDSLDAGQRRKWKSFLKLNVKKKKKRRPWHLIPSFHVKWKKYMQWHILISWAPKSLWMVTVTMKLKTLAPWKKSYDKLKQHIEKQRHHFAHKGLYSQNYCFFFSSSQVCMWELNQKEGWVSKHWCCQTAVLEKTLESPLDCKEIKPDNLKGNQPWIFIGRTDPEVETLILWPADAKS